METLLQFSTHPIALAALIIAVSWAWEDAAVIAGALLAVDQKLGVPLALTSVFIGIMSGDIALYYLGRFAQKWRGLRGWIMLKPQFRHMSKSFRHKTLFNILLIRFVPGLRTLGFTLCGMWNVSIVRFLIAMTFAGVVWIGLIFTGVYKLGSADFIENSHWKWSLMFIAVFMLAFNNVWSYYQYKRRSV